MMSGILSDMLTVKVEYNIFELLDSLKRQRQFFKNEFQEILRGNQIIF